MHTYWVKVLVCTFVAFTEVFGITVTDIANETTTTETPDYVCPSETISTSSYGNFTFPVTRATEVGTNVTVACPFGEVIHGMEPISLPFTIEIPDLPQTEIEKPGGIRACILELDSSLNMMIPRWTEFQIVSCKKEDNYMIENDVRTLVLDAPQITPWNYKQVRPLLYALKFQAVSGDYNSAITFIDTVGKLLSTVALFEDVYMETTRQELFTMIDEFADNVYLTPGYKVSVSNAHLAVESTSFPFEMVNIKSGPKPQDISHYKYELSGMQFQLPREALIMSYEQTSKVPRLKVTTYSKDLKFHWDYPQVNATYGEDNADKIIGDWQIFSAELLNANIDGLHDTFQYEVETSREGKYNFTCVYWDVENKIWSTFGMNTIEHDGSVLCQSTHLTSFSLLIDPLPLPFPGSDYAPLQDTIHARILSILSAVGSAISIIGLAGTILTYGLFRCLRRERSNRILLNLSISLLFMHLFSISSDKDLWDGYCMVPAMLLQYFLHASLSWMFMEALHMYQLLISVFVKPESRFLTKRFIAAWGVPLIIVSVCAAIAPEVYSSGRSGECIIAAHENIVLYYLGYLLPIVLILAFNLVVFCRIFVVLYKQTARQQRNKQNTTNCAKTKKVPGLKRQTSTVGSELSKRSVENKNPKTKYVMISPAQIKGAFTVMILVGAGWVLGLLAMGPFEIFFKYLFTIFNAGQGALIFVFRVILHPQACREWKKALFGLNIDSSEASTTSTTNITGRGRKSIFSLSPGFISASNSVENSLTASNPTAKDLANKLATMMKKDTLEDATLPNSNI